MDQSGEGPNAGLFLATSQTILNERVSRRRECIVVGDAYIHAAMEVDEQVYAEDLLRLVERSCSFGVVRQQDQHPKLKMMNCCLRT